MIFKKHRDKFMKKINYTMKIIAVLIIYSFAAEVNTQVSQQWLSSYNGPGNSGDQGSAVTIDASGNVYVTGSSSGSGTSNDYATIKYNSSGVQQWVARYNGPGNSNDAANSIAVDGSGNVYVTGYSTGSGTGLDYAAIKYHDGALPVEIVYFNSYVRSNNVVLSWGTSWELNNSGFEAERRVHNGNWQKIGFVQGYGTANEPKDYFFEDKKPGKGKYQYRLKQVDYNGGYEYHSLNKEIVIGNPAAFSVSRNYPNPSNPKSKIDFHIPVDGKVTIKVYDVTGREAAVLTDEFKPAYFYSVEFDGSNLSSGVYFYSIIVRQAGSSAGEFKAVKKMILVK